MEVAVSGARAGVVLLACAAGVLAQQGVAMGSGGMHTVKICMSKEMVERNEMPAQQQGNCKSTVSPRSGNTMKMSYVCTQPPSIMRCGVSNAMRARVPASGTSPNLPSSKRSAQ